MKQVLFEVTLPATLKRKATYWISSCPALDVTSQGKTHAEAKKNLEAAVGLFLRSCYERGVLDTVLKECGFSMVEHARPTKKAIEQQFIKVPLHLLAHNRCLSECRA